MASIWAKIDALLPVNPKAFNAGFWGTTIFVHLVLINKAHGCNGSIPAKFVEPGYLARYLQISNEVASGTVQTPQTGERSETPINKQAADVVRLGLKQAREAKLITLDSDGAHLVGWDETWDKNATSSAERGRKYRERQRTEKDERKRTDERSENEANEPNADRNANDRVDKNRLDQNRVNLPNPPSQEGTPLAEEKEPVKPKAKRKSKLDKLLAKHGEEAGELWDLQEMLRAGAIPNSRVLKADRERLGRVCERLAEGATFDDCRAVLKSYAAESKRNPENSRHFNGVTPWIKKNFDRTLGGIGAKAAPKAGRARPMARSEAGEAGEQEIK